MREGARIYVPAEVVLDSQFPSDEKIVVEIDQHNRVLKLRPPEIRENSKRPGRLNKRFESRRHQRNKTIARMYLIWKGSSPSLFF